MYSTIKIFLERLLMSNFFDSEIIQNELEEINELQKTLYRDVMEFSTMERDEQVEHIDLLTELLDRQKIMYARLSLSDDPEAINMKNHLQKSIPLMGFPTGTDMNLLFDGMKKTISQLKENIDKL
tara:strand:- start:253 stop:627 length:375 start_codon:yes stop_codon:yes gene_type:complete